MARTVAVGAVLLLAGCGSAGPAASTSPPAASPAATATAGTAAACLQSSSPPPSPGSRPGPQVPALTTIQFVSPRQGWAAGRGRILATTDAGATWAMQYQGPSQLILVDFVDTRTGWAVALDSLLGTTDGGRCWRRLGEPDQPLVSVHFVDPRRGWGVTGSTGSRANGLPNTIALGDGVPAPPAGGRLAVTDDGGRSWRIAPTAPADVQSVCFSDPGHGWLGARGHLHRSGDGGTTWRPVPGLPDPGGGSSVISLQCAAPDSAWLLDLSLQGAAGNQPYAAFASVGGHPPVELFEDMVGGTTTRPAPGTYPGPFSVIDASTAAFLGLTPALPPDLVGFEEAAVSAAAAVAVTHIGRVPGIDRAWGASFASPTTGWVVADAGQRAVILVTTDAGRTWTRQYATAP
ncbi:MAG: hypothetical protein QOE72_373 [Chloroflexota bacterium]|nr:hypothetical protein [Chloroflexota bacterium]